ncbi:MAG TPA: flagellar hook protein FlgE [Symbiobacteriaceae bacterium]|nr:flagellar hook protein FlgE [Symbiobacteriaceae bacterium]
MMRSMYSSIQGLRAHQQRMDAIGNNIANVNTIGYKSQRVTFSSAFAQTLTGSLAPSATRGGVNAQQIGLGVGVGSIDSLMGQGSLQTTGQVTDLAISGNGFFVLKEGGKFLYTRAGNFDFDAQGYMVSKTTGQRVQGWLPDTTGAFPARDVSTITDLQIPLTDKSLAKPTDLVKFDQALNSLAANGDVHTTAVKVYDSLGNAHILDVALTKTATNDWTIDVTSADTNVPSPLVGGGGNPTSIPFKPDGTLDYATAGITPAAPFELTFDADFSFYTTDPTAQTIRFDLSKITQVAMSGVNNQSNLRAYEQDGYEAGDLEGINVDNQGMVTAFYTNGQQKAVGQVGMATFANPAGLLRDQNSNWMESNNSGMARFGAPGTADRGAIAPSRLEMSNVDLSSEFTEMIVTQRGFQANSRTITTTDELLQELVNLKR